MLLPSETYPGDLSVGEEGSDVISVHPSSAERLLLALGWDPAGMVIVCSTAEHLLLKTPPIHITGKRNCVI